MSITPSTATAGATSTYTVTFTATASGALAATLSDYITVTFPSGFTIPGSPSITFSSGFTGCNVTTTTGIVSSQDVEADLPSGCHLANSATATITIAGITNPSAGSYSGSKIYTSSDTTTVNAANITITAAATTTTAQPATFALTFWDNFTDGGHVDNQQTFTDGVAQALDGDQGSRTGFLFTGWNTDPRGGGTSYQNGDSLTLHGPFALYAQWHQPTITFHGNGGSGSMSQQQIPYGDSRPLTKNTFFYAGHVFIGWGLSSEQKTTFIADGQDLQGNSDYDLYAAWAPIPVPTGVTATPGLDSVQIAFTAPADPYNAITGYTVETTDGAHSQTVMASPATITGLTPGTAYTFQVSSFHLDAATSSLNPGAPSDTVQATPLGPPDPPTKVSAVANRNGTITITLTPPADDGGSPVLGYEISGLDDTTATPGGIAELVPAGDGSLTVHDGLSPGSAYKLRLRAYTIADPSTGADTGTGADTALATAYSTYASASPKVQMPTIYWVSADRTSIDAAFPDGGSPQPVSFSPAPGNPSIQGPFGGVAVSGGGTAATLYFIAQDGFIGSSNLDGSDATLAALPVGIAASHVAANRTTLYWSDVTSGCAIHLESLGGQLSKVRIAPQSCDQRGQFAVDSDHVYWINPKQSTIGCANAAGTHTDQSFHTAPDGARALASDGAFLYVITASKGILRVPLGDTCDRQTSPLTPLRATGSGSDIAVGLGRIAWLGGGTVGLASSSGGHPGSIGSADAGPGGVVFSPPSAPSQPLNVTAKPGTNGSAIVTWDPPATDGGADITGYSVTVLRERQPVTTVRSDGSTTTSTIEGLDPLTQYSFVVKALNPIWSPSTSVTPQSTITTGRVRTETTFKASPNPVALHKASWTATVSPAPPAGSTVVFAFTTQGVTGPYRVTETTNADGVAEIPFGDNAPLLAGTFRVTAQFLATPSGYLGSASDATSVEVAKAETTTTVSLDAADPANEATFPHKTILVTGDAPRAAGIVTVQIGVQGAPNAPAARLNGSATFQIDGTGPLYGPYPVKDGVATIPRAFAPDSGVNASAHTLVASFHDNANLNASTSATLNYNVLDNARPTLTLPRDRQLVATTPDGTGTATSPALKVTLGVKDNVDSQATLLQNLNCGLHGANSDGVTIDSKGVATIDQLPTGISTVTCSLSDSTGNTLATDSAKSFQVVVVPAKLTVDLPDTVYGRASGVTVTALDTANEPLTAIGYPITITDKANALDPAAGVTIGRKDWENGTASRTFAFGTTAKTDRLFWSVGGTDVSFGVRSTFDAYAPVKRFEVSVLAPNGKPLRAVVKPGDRVLVQAVPFDSAASQTAEGGAATASSAAFPDTKLVPTWKDGKQTLSATVTVSDTPTRAYSVKVAEVDSPKVAGTSTLEVTAQYVYWASGGQIKTAFSDGGHPRTLVSNAHGTVTALVVTSDFIWWATGSNLVWWASSDGSSVSSSTVTAGPVFNVTLKSIRGLTLTSNGYVALLDTGTYSLTARDEKGQIVTSSIAGFQGSWEDKHGTPAQGVFNQFSDDSAELPPLTGAFVYATGPCSRDRNGTTKDMTSCQLFGTSKGLYTWISTQNADPHQASTSVPGPVSLSGPVTAVTACPDGSFYWATARGILRYSSAQQTTLGVGSNAAALACDGTHLFWADSGGLHRSQLDGTAATTIVASADPITALTVKSWTT